MWGTDGFFDMTDELYSQLRRRTLDAQRHYDLVADRRELVSSPIMIGKVFSQTLIPSGTNVYYAVHPVAILGPETEGGAATCTVDSAATFMVCVVGSRSPSMGDYLVCRYVGNRWVSEITSARQDVGIGGCECQGTPLTLTMSVNEPTTNNGIFQDSALTWQDTPAGFAAIVLATKAYLSWPQGYVDQVTGDTFYYYLSCVGNYYTLTRVYLISVYGSPFLDQIRYQWRIDDPGNSCDPFLMTNGQVYNGGNPTCIVTLSG